MNLGDTIRKYRKEKGLTQKELGQLCGINESQIRRYELGGKNSKPKLETIQKIAKALEVSIFDLLDFDSTMDLARKILEDSKSNYELNIADSLGKIAENKYKEKYPLEIRLLAAFDELNEQGKQKIMDYIEDIVKLPQYQNTKE